MACWVCASAEHLHERVEWSLDGDVIGQVLQAADQVGHGCRLLRPRCRARNAGRLQLSFLAREAAAAHGAMPALSPL